MSIIVYKFSNKLLRKHRFLFAEIWILQVRQSVICIYFIFHHLYAHSLTRYTIKRTFAMFYSFKFWNLAISIQSSVSYRFMPHQLYNRKFVEIKQKANPFIRALTYTLHDCSATNEYKWYASRAMECIMQSKHIGVFVTADKTMPYLYRCCQHSIYSIPNSSTV